MLILVTSAFQIRINKVSRISFILLQSCNSEYNQLFVSTLTLAGICFFLPLLPWTRETTVCRNGRKIWTSCKYIAFIFSSLRALLHECKMNKQIQKLFWNTYRSLKSYVKTKIQLRLDTASSASRRIFKHGFVKVEMSTISKSFTTILQFLRSLYQYARLAAVWVIPAYAWFHQR